MCVPALAWAMMSNNVMRAEGKPRLAMLAMLLPALSNIALDVLFIVILDWGLRGAAWATAGAYTLGGLYGLWFFLLGPGEVRLLSRNLRWDYPLVREISSIGVVTLARQGAVSLLTIVLNHTLFSYGDELAIAIYGVINRIMMFANFPVLGITQGFLPIAGYNFGARQWKRVSEVIRASVLAGTGIAVALLVVIVAFAPVLVGLFTTDPELLNPTPRALKIVFGAMPLIPAQLIGSAYFQANGKALPALLLTLTKQGFFLVPLVLVLPLWLGLDGVWIAFPLADVLAASVTLLYLRREIRVHLLPAIQEEEAMQVAKRQQEALALSRGKKIS
jgi:Na+-driven multidrug efflux pump